MENESLYKEYPASAEEAFLVTGNTVFDQTILQEMEVSAPNYSRAYDSETNYFEDSREGHLSMWTLQTLKISL